MGVPVLAPNSTWFSQGGTTIKRASITQINIVDSYTPTGNETASWDASAAKDGSVMVYVTGTVLTIAGNGRGKVFLNTDSSDIFADSKKVDYFKNITAINGGEILDTMGDTSLYRAFNYCEKLVVAPTLPKSDITNLQATFQNCYALTTVNCADWDTSKVTTLRNTFKECYTLKNIDVSSWDTSKVTTMYQTFHNCHSLEELDLSGWDVSEVTTMLHAFGSSIANAFMKLTSIGDVSGWDVGKVESMYSMFDSCQSLTELDIGMWNTSSCTDMSYMFNKCKSLTSLDVSNWDVSKVTAMRSMFNLCTSLETLDVSNWNTSSCTNMSYMFNECESLTSLDVSNWNTSSCTNMPFMFYGLNGLTQPLDVSNWDVSKVTNFDHMMAHSYATLNGVENWEVSSACTNMNAMFHSVQNTSLDVSKFDTSNVQFFSQMFQSANKLTKIIGLENFNTANVLGFEEMFQYCSALKELNLSSFDTRKAKDGVVGSTNGHLTATMQNMFQDNFKLKKISLGVNFSFKGDGTTTNTANYAVLPTPSADYIYGADGNWYTEDGTAYAPADVPSNTAGTYYASLSLLGGGMSAGKKYILRSILPPIVARAMIKKYDS